LEVSFGKKELKQKSSCKRQFRLWPFPKQRRLRKCRIQRVAQQGLSHSHTHQPTSSSLGRPASGAQAQLPPRSLPPPPISNEPAKTLAVPFSWRRRRSKRRRRRHVEARYVSPSSIRPPTHPVPSSVAPLLNFANPAFFCVGMERVQGGEGRRGTSSACRWVCRWRRP
jgi:hypothetical protein